jgi:hypothetical protein
MADTRPWNAARRAWVLAAWRATMLLVAGMGGVGPHSQLESAN